MKIRMCLVAAAAAGVVACGQPTTQTPTTRNLDRPTDVAFACYGGLKVGIGAASNSSQPLAACDYVAETPPQSWCFSTHTPPLDPLPNEQAKCPDGSAPVKLSQARLPGQEEAPPLTYYGFVLQPTTGTVAVGQWPARYYTSQADDPIGTTIVDVDHRLPGINALAVGSMPVAITGDRDGCHMITANAGSCDLSVIDTNSVIDLVKREADAEGPKVSRLAVVNGTDQAILARPAAMVAQAPASAADVGAACPAGPQGLQWIAYPDCHIVAAVKPDGDKAVVTAAIRFSETDNTATVVPAAELPTLSCPAQCGDDTMPIVGGATWARPVTLDLVRDERVDTRRLVIGADNSNRVTVVDLGADFLPTAVQQVTLEGEVGVLDVALSRQIGMGGGSGTINDPVGPGGQAQFVYAVASDGTVRVVDLLPTARECDTQIDPRYLHDENSIPLLSCLPMATPDRPRRAGAIGPGIQLVGDAVPTSVTIVRSGQSFTHLTPQGRPDGKWHPDRLIGHFAFIAATTGETFIVNIDDDTYADLESASSPLDVTLPQSVPHQLRDLAEGRQFLRTPQTGSMPPPDGVKCDDLGPVASSTSPFGGARIAVQNQLLLLDKREPSDLAAERNYATPGPRFVACTPADPKDALAVPEMSFSAPPEVREAAFPDLRALRDETWSLTWEGSLTFDPRALSSPGPSTRIATIPVDRSGMRIFDPARPFCALGAQDFDIVQLFGCDPTRGDRDCAPGDTCYVDPLAASGSAGTCLAEDRLSQLASTCHAFLVSNKRYAIATSTADVLHLRERRWVLDTTPVDGCTGADQCVELANLDDNLRIKDRVPLDTMDRNTEDNNLAPATYACEADPSRPPGPSRCMMTCTPNPDKPDAGCETQPGTVCSADGFCVEGAIPAAACVAGLQRYQVRASEAFVVSGSTTGYLHSVIESGDGRCVLNDGTDPTRPVNPLEVGRIPLNVYQDPADNQWKPLPACTADGLTDVLPNPCLATMPVSEMVPRYQPGTCTVADASVLETRDDQVIRFRNPAFTFNLATPWYPGDAMCYRDRLGTLGKIPTVSSGYQVQITLTGGLYPVVTSPSVYPSSVVRGPHETVWTIDEGEYLPSGSITTVRGQVWEYDPVTASGALLQ